MGRPQAAKYPSLSGLSVFVTGGASGIGEAVVRDFAAQGAKVAFVDIEAEKGAALAKEIAAAGDPEPFFQVCDIRDIEALRAAMAAAIARNGELAALVNNAANDTRHKLKDLTVEYWDDRFAVNLRPMVFAAQVAAESMKKRGGGTRTCRRRSSLRPAATIWARRPRGATTLSTRRSRCSTLRCDRSG